MADTNQSGAFRPERAKKQPSGRKIGSEKADYSILDRLNDGVYGIDSRGYINFMNRTLMERRSIQSGQYRHIHYIDLIDPECHEQAKKNFARVMKGEEGIPLELKFADPGGKVRIVEVHSMPVREGGKVVGLMGISRDITKRKRMEEQLWANQEQLRLALRAGRQGYFDWDVHKDHIFYSDEYLELLGYGRDEIEARIRAWKKRVHPRDKAAVLRTLQEHLDGGTIRYEVTYRMKVKSGAWRWFRGHGEVVGRDDKGRPLRMMGTIVDVTPYKEFEEELERRVEERTAELVEINSALKVLLRQREQDKSDAEEAMAANLKFMVLPYLNRLRRSGLDLRQKEWVSLIADNLTQVTSPFIRKLGSRYATLTPRELQVAERVRSGKSSKEIAETMGISVKTVDVLRYSIRKKLGLNRKKTNLQSRLSSL